MDFSLLNIILVVIVVIAVAAYVVTNIRNKRYLLKATRRLDSKYTSLLSKAESENRRLTALYNDLKAKSTSNKLPEHTSGSFGISHMERIAAEQTKLEAQQSELAERNRQLWNMSLTIEKDRQNIQHLKEEIELQHRSITSSIRYAKQIQIASLPPEEMLNESFLDTFLLWRPRDIVSGDFYWMKRISDNVIFTIGDCTGHGVPGGFLSMLGVAFLNDICVDFTSETTPAIILEQLRNKVITTLKHDDDQHLVQKDGIDMGICILNLTTNKMQFAGANNGMYHMRGTQLTEYKPVHNPIGEYPRKIPFENRDVDITTGDYIYLFTDGFTDQLNLENHKFTPRRLRMLLCDINAKTKKASEQASILREEFDRWRQGNNQMDDILIGGYCIK
ncbi:MAG: SpoIIE family protein phosphatase [Bacteroidales bacterium]|nr:SpoIIE family protein phosphatase [Bacteroidales bacterium]